MEQTTQTGDFSYEMTFSTYGLTVYIVRVELVTVRAASSREEKRFQQVMIREKYPPEGQEASYVVFDREGAMSIRMMSREWFWIPPAVMAKAHELLKVIQKNKDIDG